MVRVVDQSLTKGCWAESPVNNTLQSRSRHRFKRIASDNNQRQARPGSVKTVLRLSGVCCLARDRFGSREAYLEQAYFSGPSPDRFVACRLRPFLPRVALLSEIGIESGGRYRPGVGG